MNDEYVITCSIVYYHSIMPDVLAVSELYSLQDDPDDPVRILNIKILDPLSLKQLRRRKDITFERVNFLFSPSELFRSLSSQLQHLAIISCEFVDPASTALSSLIKQQQENAARPLCASKEATTITAGAVEPSNFSTVEFLEVKDTRMEVPSSILCSVI